MRAKEWGAPPTDRLRCRHSVENDRPDQIADLRAKCLVLRRYQRADRVTGQLGLRDGGLDAPGRMCEAAILAPHHGSGLDGKVHVCLHWLVGEGSFRETGAVAFCPFERSVQVPLFGVRAPRSGGQSCERALRHGMIGHTAWQIEL
jgi:hypothetical protein